MHLQNMLMIYGKEINDIALNDVLAVAWADHFSEVRVPFRTRTPLHTLSYTSA